MHLPTLTTLDAFAVNVLPPPPIDRLGAERGGLFPLSETDEILEVADASETLAQPHFPYVCNLLITSRQSEFFFFSLKLLSTNTAHERTVTLFSLDGSDRDPRWRHGPTSLTCARSRRRRPPPLLRNLSNLHGSMSPAKRPQNYHRSMPSRCRAGC